MWNRKALVLLVLLLLVGAVVLLTTNASAETLVRSPGGMVDLAVYQPKHGDESGIIEVRGRRSSRSYSWSYSSPSYSSPSPSYPSLSYSPSPSDQKPSHSNDSSSEQKSEANPEQAPDPSPVPTPTPKKRTVNPSPASQRATDPVPDCPRGTTLARLEGRNICFGTPETLANITKPGATETPVGSNTLETQPPMKFTDVLSGLQAQASASGEPVHLIPGRGRRGGEVSPPVAGLLNCGEGTRPTHVYGRIECR
jgi:hypothetical protein